MPLPTDEEDEFDEWSNDFDSNILSKESAT